MWGPAQAVLIELAARPSLGVGGRRTGSESQRVASCRLVACLYIGGIRSRIHLGGNKSCLGRKELTAPEAKRPSPTCAKRRACSRCEFRKYEGMLRLCVAARGLIFSSHDLASWRSHPQASEALSVKRILACGGGTLLWPNRTAPIIRE